jgi:hypothetical protein
MKESERESERRGLPLDHVVEDASDARGGVVYLVLGVVMLGLGIIMLTVGSSPVGVVFLVVGGFLLFKSARSFAVRAKWSNPQLHLPSTAPLRLGDDVVARFRRTARSADTAAGAVVTAWLTCTEAATYTTRGGGGSRGGGSTSRTTATNVLLRTDVGVTPYVHGAAVEADLRLVIPVFDAPPSMDLASNDIIWRLHVHIEAPNGPDDTSEFVVMVAPEISPLLLAPGAAS